MKKTDRRRASKFVNAFRFIDDLVLNKSGELERGFWEIYPPELEDKKEKDMNREHSLLDVGIKTNDDRFSINLYEKQHFTFSIVRMTYLRSNIPSKMFYSAFGEKPLRIAQTTSNACICCNIPESRKIYI